MKIQVADLEFEPLISAEAIQKRIAEIAVQIKGDYKGKTPIIIGILNGSFLLIADLIKHIDTPCEITFTKLASYYGGTSSSRKIRDDIDLSVNITGRDIILVEDIVDTGNTLDYLVDKLNVHKPSSVRICSLLLKPKSLEKSIDELKYVGFEIENDFVIGYGLDYKELGRNLQAIYKRV